MTQVRLTAAQIDAFLKKFEVTPLTTIADINSRITAFDTALTAESAKRSPDTGKVAAIQLVLQQHKQEKLRRTNNEELAAHFKKSLMDVIVPMSLNVKYSAGLLKAIQLGSKETVPEPVLTVNSANSVVLPFALPAAASGSSAAATGGARRRRRASRKSATRRRKGSRKA